MRRNNILRTAVSVAAVTALLGACSDSDADPDSKADESPSSASPSSTDKEASPTEQTSAPAEEVVLPDGVTALPGPDVGSDHAALAAGRYRVPLDDALSFDVDFPSESFAHDDGIFIATGAVVLKVAIADETYGVPMDPCTAQSLEPAGSTVDDVARAIGDKPAYGASRPEPARLGGAKGTYLEIDIPRTFNTSDCVGGEIQSPGTPASSVGWAPPAHGRYWILDVDGQRVVVAQECSCSADEFGRAASIAQSITFTATP